MGRRVGKAASHFVITTTLKGNTVEQGGQTEGVWNLLLLGKLK